MFLVTSILQNGKSTENTHFERVHVLKDHISTTFPYYTNQKGHTFHQCCAFLNLGIASASSLTHYLHLFATEYIDSKD